MRRLQCGKLQMSFFRSSELFLQFLREIWVSASLGLIDPRLDSIDICGFLVEDGGVLIHVLISVSQHLLLISEDIDVGVPFFERFLTRCKEKQFATFFVLRNLQRNSHFGGICIHDEGIIK